MILCLGRPIGLCCVELHSASNVGAEISTEGSNLIKDCFTFPVMSIPFLDFCLHPLGVSSCVRCSNCALSWRLGYHKVYYLSSRFSEPLTTGTCHSAQPLPRLPFKEINTVTPIGITFLQLKSGLTIKDSTTQVFHSTGLPLMMWMGRKRWPMLSRMPRVDGGSLFAACTA